MWQTWWAVIKLFFFVTTAATNYAALFVPGEPFKPSFIFPERPRTYHRKELVNGASPGKACQRKNTLAYFVSLP
jgi:hypothetical protein